MNTNKMITNLIRRSYGTQRKWKKYSNPGVQKRLNVLEDDPEKNLESTENIDLDNVEPNFMQAHVSYKLYKKELKTSKEKLKLRIVARKYFNVVEPSLLTYMEKEQIRFLHASDPVEYTPEKLSESFPTLPHTIKKILRAKWTPRSADKVLKHDELVIENWKKFKRGELPLDPDLREHLEKFKKRIISLPNKEDLEKIFIRPEKTFAKPRSQLYSGIIQRYLDQKKDNDVDNKDTSISDKEQSDSNYEDGLDERLNRNILTDRCSDVEESNESIPSNRYEKQIAVSNNNELLEVTKIKGAKFRDNNLVNLDEFFKHSVRNIDSVPSIEDRVLVDTYRRKIESDMAKEKNTGKDDWLNPQGSTLSVKVDDSVTVLDDKNFQTRVEVHKEPESTQVVEDSKEFGLETYVKVWEKKASQEEHYPEFIKIPKTIYSKGKLYKLRDCYYDDDGEFLYRVPGFRE